MKNKLISIIQILALFILPIVLLVSGIIPIQYRFIVLGAIVLITILIIIKEKGSLKN